MTTQLTSLRDNLTPHGSVASDDAECSQHGVEILKLGGNSVDAAITTALCSSVAFPHLSGLGGNGVMLIYDHRTGKGNVVDFLATQSSHPSIGIPGFLAGLYYSHSKYGKLSWKTLVQPSIELAKNGIKVTESLLESINQQTLESFKDDALKKWLTIVTTCKPGEIIKAPDGLLNTLILISTHGPNAFYKTMSNELSYLVNSNEIQSYKVLDYPTIQQGYMSYNIITSSKGTGGPIFFEILSTLNNTNNEDIVVSIANNFKGFDDTWFENTGLQISTTDINDLYVTTINGLGAIFGSGILTSSGYILNNALEISIDYEKDNSTRPTSLFLPFIVVEKDRICGRRLISGSADVRDGAQILLQLLKINPQNIVDINSTPRVRLNGNNVGLEFPNSFPKKLESLLSYAGFNISEAFLPYPTSNLIQKIEDLSFGLSDSRGSGISYTI
ncbi:glutathione hydrolase 7-like isoform X2 [Daktulosphaira vitifoliae]|uniref:glutathione hydrolase 7-like isoform X2 n=1 Tax=Daktulosphaira vitifoliae TaxID=58002 RepID=UPI0021AA5AAB|nr:glutathione hydrolase 7-like isoform X2 [Daktulosphaira vitifoliae]